MFSQHYALTIGVANVLMVSTTVFMLQLSQFIFQYPDDRYQNSSRVDALPQISAGYVETSDGLVMYNRATPADPYMRTNYLYYQILLAILTFFTTTTFAYLGFYIIRRNRNHNDQ
jgi:hypothetical protein